MKKLLILACIACLLVPTIVLAAGAGGSANRYALKVDQIAWHKARTTQLVDSTACSLEIGATGFGGVGIPETSAVYEAWNVLCPMGAGAFMGFTAMTTAGMAAGDSVGVFLQWSPDKVNWFGVNTTKDVAGPTPTVWLVSTTFNLLQAHAVLVEAATMPTTPMWKYVRFIAQKLDQGSAATMVTGFKLWWYRYEKVNY